MSAPARTQIRRGVGLAAAAALAFGATIPLLKLASAGVGVFTCGGLLYLGAAIAGFGAIAIRRRPGGAGPWRAPQLARLLGLAALGAVCAPALLVVGIKRTDAVTTSLLLTLEAPFTMLLARLLFHEHLGGRALAAAGLILAGAALAAAPWGAGGAVGLGTAFVAAAMLAWALDNAVSRTFADRDPLAVVVGKGMLGGTLSACVAALAGEARPSGAAVAAIAAIGAVGYGVSLVLYLRAQALIGAARTASVFAAAPFVGSAVALALGAPWPGVAVAARGGAHARGRLAARLRAPRPPPPPPSAPARAPAHPRRRTPHPHARPDAGGAAQPRARTRGGDARARARRGPAPPAPLMLAGASARTAAAARAATSRPGPATPTRPARAAASVSRQTSTVRQPALRPAITSNL